MKGFPVITDSVLMAFRCLFNKNLKCRIPSIISPNVSLIAKKGTIEIGRIVNMRKNTEISANGGTVLIENNVFINRNCIISSHELIHIKAGVTIGPGTYIYDHDHNESGGYNTAPVTIEENVWIGAGCIVLKGVRIGKNSTVAAGCLITKDIPPNSIVIQKRVNTITPKVKGTSNE